MDTFGSLTAKYSILSISYVIRSRNFSLEQAEEDWHRVNLNRFAWLYAAKFSGRWLGSYFEGTLLMVKGGTIQRSYHRVGSPPIFGKREQKTCTILIGCVEPNRPAMTPNDHLANGKAGA